MFVTTSLKLSEELKQRTVIAASDVGLSTHAFMVKVIEQAAKISSPPSSGICCKE